MKHFYYHMRNRQGHPTGTVCAFRRRHHLIAGFAYCNPKDRFRKSIGRGLAYRRMCDRALTDHGSAVLVISTVSINHRPAITSLQISALDIIDFSAQLDHVNRVMRIPWGVMMWFQQIWIKGGKHV